MTQDELSELRKEFENHQFTDYILPVPKIAFGRCGNVYLNTRMQADWTIAQHFYEKGYQAAALKRDAEIAALKRDVNHWKLQHGRKCEEIAALKAELEAAKKRLNDNTTFYEVLAPFNHGVNIPVLAEGAKRIWYHATDDQTSFPFSSVIDADRAKMWCSADLANGEKEAG